MLALTLRKIILTRWWNLISLIYQLLKLDFEPISTTIRRNFRQTINMTIKSHLLPIAQQQADKISADLDSL